jgi:hypothetical protein
MPPGRYGPHPLFDVGTQLLLIGNVLATRPPSLR